MLGGDAEVEFTYRFADPAERAWMDASARRGLRDRRLPLARSPCRAPAPSPSARWCRSRPSTASIRSTAASRSPAAASLAAALDAAGRPARARRREGARRPARPRARRRRPPRHPGLPPRRHPRSPSPTPASEHAELRPAGDRAPRRPRRPAGCSPRARCSIPPTASASPPTPTSPRSATRRAARFGDTGLQWRDRRSGPPGVGRFVDRLGILPRPRRARRPRGGRRRRRRGGARAPRGEDRDHRDPEDARRHRRHGLRRLSDPDRPPRRCSASLSASLLGAAAAARRRALRRRPAAGAGRVRPLPPPAGRGRALRRADGAPLHPLAARPRPRHPRRRAVPRPDRRAPGLAAPRLRRRHRRGSPPRWSPAPPCSPTRRSSRSARPAAWPARFSSLLAAAWGLRRLARRLGRGGLVRGRPALRWALAALGGPSGETASVVLSLGLGLSVLAAVGQIDWNLRNLVTRDLPERAPAFFFVDIQNDQLEGFLERAEAVPGVEAIETAPMLRGIITRINGRPAREVAGPHWVLSGDRGVTYAAAPARGHGHHRRRVVAGGLRRPAADELRRRGGPRARPEARRQADRQHPRPRPDRDHRELPRGALRDDGDQLPDHARPGGARRRAAHPHRHRLRRPGGRGAAAARRRRTPTRTSPPSASATRSTGSRPRSRASAPPAAGPRPPRSSPASSC